MSSATIEYAILSIIADEMTERHSNKKFCRFVIDSCHGMTKYYYNLLLRKSFFLYTFLTKATGLALSNEIKESLCT